MASGYPAEIIKCQACGARDVAVTDRIGSDAVVCCYRCGLILWTWPEFLSRIATAVEARGWETAGPAAARSKAERPR